MFRRTAFSITLLYALSVSGAESLTLDEVIILARKSPRLEASQSIVEASEAQLSMASGMFYPAVTISHGYMLTNDSVGVFGAKLQQGRFTQTDFDINALNNPSSVSHWRTRFQVAQPILHSLTDLKNRTASQRNLEAQTNRHRFREQQLLRDTTRLYFTGAALKAKQGIVGEGIERLKKLEASYQVMEAPTGATTTNYLIAQSVRLELEARQSAFQAGNEEIRRSLLALLGLPPHDDTEFVDPLPEVTSEGTPRVDSSPRPDVEATLKEERAAHASLSAARSTWGPNLDFVAGYNLYTGKYDSLHDAYDVGLQLTWPLFVGPRGGQIETARAQWKMAREIARATKLESDAAYQNAIHNRNARRREYELVKLAREKASRAIAIAKKRYAQGTLPLFDYSQSIQNWVNVQLELIDARQRVADADTEVRFERGAL